jgi:hypothetical protein
MHILMHTLPRKHLNLTNHMAMVSLQIMCHLVIQSQQHTHSLNQHLSTTRHGMHLITGLHEHVAAIYFVHIMHVVYLLG